MSDDLISRKALIEEINRYYYTVNPEIRRVEHIAKAHICELIDKQPTAYDVDKVIEHLKELKTYKLNLADAMLEIMRRGELGNYVCLEDVIKIVKSGGVSDE